MAKIYVVYTFTSGMSHSKYLLLLCILVISGTFRSEGSEPEWILLAPQTTGLTDNTIESLAVDSKDVVWIATGSHGLVSFDGVKWSVFRKENSGLTSNRLKTVAVDSQDNVWVGADNGDLICITGNAFITYNKENCGFAAGQVYKVAVDTKDGIWAATRYGLFYFSGSEWINYTSSNSGLPSNWVYSLEVREDGLVAAGTLMGLALFDGDTWEVFNTENSLMTHNEVKDVAFGSKNDFWFGTQNELLHVSAELEWTIYADNDKGSESSARDIFVCHDSIVWVGTDGGGLSWFNGESWKNFLPSDSNLPSRTVLSVNQDSKGLMWIGTRGGGLTSFDGSAWSTYNTNNTGLIHGDITHISHAIDESVWISSRYNGIFQLTGFPDNIHFVHYNRNNSILPSDLVNTLIADRFGNVWIGMANDGLLKYDGQSFTRYTSSNSGLPSNNIWSLDTDRHGNIWIGTGGGGVAFYDGKNQWKVYDSSNSGLTSNSICSIRIRDGIVWAGTYTGGLAKYDGFYWHVWNTKNSGIIHNHAHNFDLDQDGNIWVAFDDAVGMGRFDGLNWDVLHSGNSPMSDNRISTVRADDSNRIWIGGRYSGLTKFDGYEWVEYNPLNSPLSSRYVRNISFDKHGNIWLATASGINVFNEKGIIVHFKDHISHDNNRNGNMVKNYPNPFRYKTTFEFSLSKNEHVSFEVFNLKGVLVGTLASGLFPPGEHHIDWKPAGLPAGMYLYRIITDNRTQDGRIILLD